MRGGMDVRALLSCPLASVTMAHLMRIFYTGAEMKLARSFTLAMFKGNFMNHWVYWVGSMICGAMGAVMCREGSHPERQPASGAGHRWGAHQTQDPGPIP
ncbi:lens fiber major intrinsic protein-like [Engraulis encrasicolus]|uniref:lens fiber major intrinsic protein-like n=1 Tax=Engraulis encrasicolus TaxID=184585 RepID=UPI002FD2A36F